MEEVFEELKCTKQGLTSDEASYRLDLFGPNKLEEKKVFLLDFSPFFKNMNIDEIFFNLMI